MSVEDRMGQAIQSRLRRDSAFVFCNLSLYCASLCAMMPSAGIDCMERTSRFVLKDPARGRAELDGDALEYNSSPGLRRRDVPA